MGVIAFRLDASTAIGGGHLSRCLTLADALRAAGRTCAFCLRGGQEARAFAQSVPARGHQLIELAPPRAAWAPAPSDPPQAAWGGAPWSDDADETSAALAAETVDWLVLDHYAFDARWTERIKPKGPRVLVIDDLDDRPADADLLLDQNRVPGAPPRANHGRRNLIGPAFALLRPDFAEARPAALARRQACADAPRHPPRILISTGLTDVGGAALASAEALATLGMAIDVAVGAQAPTAERLWALAARTPELSLHLNAPNMAQLMAAADLAIGAIGVSTWERFSVGLPALVFTLAPNQREIADMLAADGLIDALGAPAAATSEAIREKTRAALSDPVGLAATSARIAALCDGEGARRVVEAMVAAEDAGDAP